MNYTYLVVAGAVILIFLSVYSFVVEKSTIPIYFAGCTEVSGKSDCDKGVYTHNKFTLKDPAHDTSDMHFGFKLCCRNKLTALEARTTFNQMALSSNTSYLNKRLGITTNLESGGDLKGEML